MSLPWFRLYAELATDPVVQCLSFDDQRHYVMLLCFKCSGLLDRPFASRQQRLDVIRKTLGLDGKAWDEMRGRLNECRLINDDLQPINWNKRQFISDMDPTATDRQRRRRERLRHGPVTRDSRPSDADSDTDTEKNPKTRERALEGARAPVIGKGEARETLRKILAGTKARKH